MLFRFFCILTHVLAIGVLLLWYGMEPTASFSVMALCLSILCLASGFTAFLYIRQCSGESSALRNPIFVLTGVLWCFTFGYIFPYSLGLVDYDSMVFFGDESVQRCAILLASVSYLAWVVGVFACYRPPADRKLQFASSTAAAWALLFLHVASLSTYFAINGFTALTEEYGSESLAGANVMAAYSRMIYEWFYFAAGLVVVADVLSSRSLHPKHLLPLLTIFCTSLLLFLLGRRTPLALLAIFSLFYSYYWMPRFVVSRHAVRTAMFSIFALLFIFFASSVVEKYRGTNKSFEALVESVVAVWEDGWERNYIVSAGKQFGILNRIISIVPSEYFYSLGSNLPNEIFQGIPFGSRVGIYLDLPPTTITLVHDATFGEQSTRFRWGLGSHFFADCYRIFGIISCVLVPPLFSGIFCKIHSKGRNSIMRALFACFILGAAVSGFRNVLLTEIFRYGLWSFLAVYFVGQATGMRDVVAAIPRRMASGRRPGGFAAP